MTFQFCGQLLRLIEWQSVACDASLYLKRLSLSLSLWVIHSCYLWSVVVVVVVVVVAAAAAAASTHCSSSNIYYLPFHATYAQPMYSSLSHYSTIAVEVFVPDILLESYRPKSFEWRYCRGLLWVPKTRQPTSELATRRGSKQWEDYLGMGCCYRSLTKKEVLLVIFCLEK